VVHSRQAEIGRNRAVDLRGRRVGAVVIATPTSTHHELTRAALLAGKDVLVEKPITSSSARARPTCAPSSAAPPRPRPGDAERSAQ
jgi:hypothetical protein